MPRRAKRRIYGLISPSCGLSSCRPSILAGTSDLTFGAILSKVSFARRENLQADIAAVIDIVFSELLRCSRERMIRRCAKNNIGRNFWKQAPLIDFPKLASMCSIYNIDIAKFFFRPIDQPVSFIDWKLDSQFLFAFRTLAQQIHCWES